MLRRWILRLLLGDQYPTWEFLIDNRDELEEMVDSHRELMRLKLWGNGK